MGSIWSLSTPEDPPGCGSWTGAWANPFGSRMRWLGRHMTRWSQFSDEIWGLVPGCSRQLPAVTATPPSPWVKPWAGQFSLVMICHDHPFSLYATIASIKRFSIAVLGWKAWTISLWHCFFLDKLEKPSSFFFFFPSFSTSNHPMFGFWQGHPRSNWAGDPASWSRRSGTWGQALSYSSWCPQDSVQLVHITLISLGLMVDISN